METEHTGIPSPEINDVDDVQFMEFLHSIAHVDDVLEQPGHDQDGIGLSFASQSGFPAAPAVITLPASVPHTGALLLYSPCRCAAGNGRNTRSDVRIQASLNPYAQPTVPETLQETTQSISYIQALAC
jgi:hypothetical protein